MSNLSRLGELCLANTASSGTMMAASTSSSSSSANFSSRKKQMEERNLRLLRELASSQSTNKQCFDCGQRGPTYVDMTIGSFVCTKCSGLLRGLTPPHRVKSISMATFGPDEIEFLKARGNDYCKRIWAGKYTSRGPFDDGSVSKDEQQMKDYLVLKYEKKRWYIHPSEAMMIKNGFSSSSTTQSRNHSPPPPSIILQITPSLFLKQGDVQRVRKVSNSSSSVPPPISRQVTKSNDFLFDPFDDDFGSSLSVGGDARKTSLTPAADPFGMPAMPKSATVPASLSPRPIGGQQRQQEPSMDKYSALAELDEMFHVNSSTSGAGDSKNGYAADPRTFGGSHATPSTKPYANSAYSSVHHHPQGFYPTTSPISFYHQHPNHSATSSATNPFSNSIGHHHQQFQIGGGGMVVNHQGQFDYAKQFKNNNNNVNGFVGHSGNRRGFPMVSGANALNPFAVPMQTTARSATTTGGSQWNPFL